MHLTIKSKILFGLFLIIFLFILASYLVTLRIESTKNHMLAVNSLHIPLSKTLTQLKSIDESRGLSGIESFKSADFENSFHRFSRFLLTTDSLFLISTMEKFVKDYDLKTKHASNVVKETLARLLRLKIALTHYNGFSQNAMGMIRSGELALDGAIEKFLNLRHGLKRNITLFERYNDRKMRVALLTAERDGRDIVLSMTIFMVIMTIIGIFIYFMTGDSLKPLEDLYRGVKRLSAGDFKYKITLKPSRLTRTMKKIFPFKRTPGEIEILAHQFNQMSKSILDRTKELRRSERLATIGKISSEITHEIRNPLNSICLNLSLLEDEIGDNPEARELFRSIKNDIDRLSNSTRDYLNYIRPVTVAVSEESLNEIVWNIYDSFKNELNKRGIACQINIPSEDIVLPVDRDQLIRVLINLIKNAIEACEELPVECSKKISINLSKKGANYSLSIDDNGPGIDSRDMDKIFLPFFTRKHSGTGLGLGISYEIIEKMGGTLACSSKKGNETAFTVLLPANSPVKSEKSRGML